MSRSRTTQILPCFMSSHISILLLTLYTRLSSKVADSEPDTSGAGWCRGDGGQTSVTSFSNVSSRLLPSPPSLLLPYLILQCLVPSFIPLLSLLLLLSPHRGLFSALFMSPPIVLCDGFDSLRSSLHVKLNKTLHISPEIVGLK